MRKFTLTEILIVAALCSFLALYAAAAHAEDFQWADVAVATGSTTGDQTIARQQGNYNVKFVRVVPDAFTTGTLKLRILAGDSSTYYESGNLTASTAESVIPNTDSYPAYRIGPGFKFRLVHSLAQSSDMEHRIYWAYNKED